MYIDLDNMEHITTELLDAIEHLSAFRKSVSTLMSSPEITEDEKTAISLILARQMFDIFETR